MLIGIGLLGRGSGLDYGQGGGFGLCLQALTS